jgi:hypothetical protein
MKILKEERQKIILKLKKDIEDRLNSGQNVEVDDKKSGRDGTRLYVNIAKKGVKSVEVIIDQFGKLHLGVAVKGNDGGESSALIKSIMKNEGYKITKDQTNPRYEYSLDAFLNVYEFLKNHQGLEDVENGRISTKLFAYRYEPLKIVQRYKFAIDNKDQVMLDLCRSLLDADKFDDAISVNFIFGENTYREHLVPCVMIHNHVIELLNGKNNANLQDVANVVERNLKIGYIHPDDAHKLDYELNLRTKMPENWNFGDDIFSRFIYAGIELEKIKGVMT